MVSRRTDKFASNHGTKQKHTTFIRKKLKCNNINKQKKHDSD